MLIADAHSITTLKTDDFQAQVKRWQESVWGPNVSAVAAEWKLDEEYTEFTEATTLAEKLEEAADILIVIYGWASRVGANMDAVRASKFALVKDKYPARNPNDDTSNKQPVNDDETLKVLRRGWGSNNSGRFG